MRVLRRHPWPVFAVAAVFAVGGSLAVWTRDKPTGWHPGFGPDRIALTVAAGCPPLRRFDTVANPHGGSPTRLVPPDPDAILICRYGPEPATPVASELYRSFRGDAAEASAIARAADQIDGSAPPPGPISCPADVDSVTLLAFAYADGNYASLRWHDSGCEEVDNGDLAAFQMSHGFSAFQSAVNALAPPRQFEG